MKMLEWAVRKILKVAHLLYQEGLVDARAGNISFRIDDKIIITRTGSHLGELTEEDLILLPLLGITPLLERASSEMPVHREVYLRTSHRAVVHAHPPATVSLSLRKEKIIPVDSEGKILLKEVCVVEDLPSGSEALAEAVASLLQDNSLVVVRGHGVFAADRDPMKAYGWISVLERSCRILQETLP